MNSSTPHLFPHQPKTLSKTWLLNLFWGSPHSLSPGVGGGGGLWQSTECDLEVYAQQIQKTELRLRTISLFNTLPLICS